MRVFIGTCGFQKARRLHYENLDVLEVQQTFYDPRDLDTFARWRSEAPQHFIFTVKAWMLVSHEPGRLWSRLKGPVPGRREGYGSLKVTNETLWAWSETLKAAEVLRAPLIVIQTPPSFSFNEGNLGNVIKFMKSIERRGRVIVWEPRGDWWDNRRALEAVVKEAGVLIGGDILRGRLPPRDQDVIYARLHGLGGEEVNYKYKYTDQDLVRLRELLEELKPREAYILFNNVYSYEDAIRFKKMLYGESTSRSS